MRKQLNEFNQQPSNLDMYVEMYLLDWNFIYQVYLCTVYHL